MNAKSSQSGFARAVLFHGHGRPLELIDAPIPQPGSGEILVGTECCAICSSDLHTHHGRRTEPTPTVLGHEIVGRIEAFGPDSNRTDARGRPLQTGDRITWTVAASCGRCRNCRDGLDQKCASLVKYGHEKITRQMPFRGGLGDVVLLAAGTGVVKLPDDGISVETLSLANCSTATVAAVLRAGFARRNRPGMSVAVLGTGVLGLTACAMARHVYRASVVVACDRDPIRAEQAKLFGATHVCTDLSRMDDIAGGAIGGPGVDVAVELAGTVQTTVAAVAAVRTGGTVVLAGTTLPTDPLVLEPQAIVRRLLRIEGVHNYVPDDLVQAVDFLLDLENPYPIPSLIAGRFELSDVESAFNAAHDAPGRRVTVLPRS
jgi:alcohol dehydrogenase